LTSFRLEILGLTRKLIEAGDGYEPAITEYNIFTIFGVIIEEAVYLDNIPSYVGLTILALLLVITSLLVPCLHTISLLVLWFFGMKKRTKDKLVTFIEILKAWQYMEVYIISLFLGMWQIGDISETLTSALCEPLDSIFASLAYFGILSDENARCFYSDARMGIGAYVLFGASIILSWLSNFILEAEKHRTTYKFINDHSETSEKDTINMNHINISFQESSLHNSKQDFEELTKSIQPVSQQFTDKFRWFLVPSQLIESKTPIDECNMIVASTIPVEISSLEEDIQPSHLILQRHRI